MQLYVTGFFTGIMGLLFLSLAIMVSQKRRKYQVGLGDGGHKDLAQAIRVHGNFSEHVPLGLLLIFFVEQQHESMIPAVLLGVALTIGRILHAIGLGRSDKATPGRLWGTLLTWITLAVGSLFTLTPWIGLHF